ncbi:MAG: AAA family ATPase [Burkholderiales bacterium]
MKLRRLRIEHFKRFREPFTIESFADGLNLFAAPNESGKSTIAEAIRAAFFERHRSGSVEHLRPWGETAATPTVAVDFDIAGRRYRLTKAFLGRKRCELAIDGQPPLDGTTAEDHLAGLLGFKFPGKGASAPEHMGIPGLLWIRQGTSHELTDAVTYASDHLRRVLGESLGDLTASSGDALLRTVEAERNRLLTPSTGNPRGEYAEALQRRSDLTAAVEALTRDIVAYRDSVDRLASLRREHRRDEQERPWATLREQHRSAQSHLDAAQGLATRQVAEQASLQQWGAQVNALRSQVDAFRREEAAVVARTQAVQQAASAEATAQADVETSERRHREVADEDDRSRQQLERVRAVAARSELAKSAADLDLSVRTLTDALAKARDERTRLTQLEAEANALAIAPADLKQLKHLSDSLRDVGVRLEAVATSLEFDLVDGRDVSAGGEMVTGHARRTVVRRTAIEIAGVGRITVSPGGLDLDALAAERDRLAGALESVLNRLLIANVAEAEERARQSAQRRLDAQGCQKVLDALAPKGVDALEADLKARTARLAEVRDALAALPPPAESDTALPVRSVSEAAAERARASLEAAVIALNAAKVAAAKAQSDLAGAREELDAAAATVNDPQREGRIASVEHALSGASIQEAAARQRVDDIGAELKSVNLSLLKQDVDRFATSARQLEDAHERRRDDIRRLEIELEAKGGFGLEEQRAEKDRELEAATRRAGELARRAAALDHLLDVLREKRSALARQLRAPLQKHLDRYLQILFPGARIEVADDLSPGTITRAGPRGIESGEFEELSVGAREQMGIVARLAYADLLQEAGRPTLLILDDALVHTDQERLGQMKRVLYDAAQRHQVLIFTCHPGAWRDLGVVARSIESPSSVSRSADAPSAADPVAE